MKTIAVDFDGVIHAYRQGWQDGSIYDEPMPGAFDALRELMTRYAVFIHTTRDPQSVAYWLSENGAFDAIVDPLGYERTFWNDQTALLVTSRKLAAVAYIDDRAIRFVDWVQTLEALANPEVLSADAVAARVEATMKAESDRLAAPGDARSVEQGIGVVKAINAVLRAIRGGEL